MSPICIVTDCTAQFRQPSFVGSDLVQVIPLDIELNCQAKRCGEEVKASNLPKTAWGNLYPKIHPLSEGGFRDLFNSLAQSFDEIIGIFPSAQLISSYTIAQEAAKSLRGSKKLILVDSQTISIGLGLLVERASESIAKGYKLVEVEQIVRSMIPRIYAVLCTPGLSYMYFNHFLDAGQAIIGEFLGLYPIFAIEDGGLVPLEKMRNHRNSINYFQEFLDEFDHLQHIALLQSNPMDLQDIHVLREHIHENFPKTPFTSHTVNLPLAALFGPQTIGLFVVETDHHKNG